MKKVTVSLSLIFLIVKIGFSQQNKFNTIGVLSGKAFLNNDNENSAIVNDYNNNFGTAAYLQSISTVQVSNEKTNLFGGFYEYKMVGFELNFINNTYHLTEIIPNSTYTNGNWDISHKVVYGLVYFKPLYKKKISPLVGWGIQDDVYKITGNGTSRKDEKNKLIFYVGIDAKPIKLLTIKIGYSIANTSSFLTAGIGVNF